MYHGVGATELTIRRSRRSLILHKITLCDRDLMADAFTPIDSVSSVVLINSAIREHAKLLSREPGSGCRFRAIPLIDGFVVAAGGMHTRVEFTTVGSTVYPRQKHHLASFGSYEVSLKMRTPCMRRGVQDDHLIFSWVVHGPQSL
jgi:hypothetical protein